MNKGVWVVFPLLVGSVAAQLNTTPLIQRVRVRLVFADGKCDSSTSVKLQGSTGLVAEASPDNECDVEFSNIPEGNYDLKITGLSFLTSSSVVTASHTSSDFEVKVNRIGEAAQARNSLPAISVTDLAVPAKARKEFDKANQLIARQEFSKAIETLNRAIADYPSYAGAYNNLGVIYARLGDRQREREVLEKAISINDRFAPAYVNVARMDIAAQDFAGAEAALNRAVACAPNDSMTLVLLTYSEFMNHHMDEAIATSRQAHAIPGSHASVHLIAARSFEQKRDRENSIAELQLFLKEEPSGERADMARKDLNILQASYQSSR